MRAVIRADASIRLGSGHVVRCLTLADGLRQKAFDVSFLSQDLPGNLCGQAEARGFPVKMLPPLEGASWQEDAGNAAAALAAMPSRPDWLIVDHYALDRRWEDAVRPHAERIMVIDDLANRPHDCEVLLDQICTDDAHRYDGLLPGHCRKLTGSAFVLLRPEFAAARARGDFPARYMNNNLAHVFFGTSDEPGYTVRFSRLLLEHFPALRLRIAVGDSFMHPGPLAELARQYGGRVSIERSVANMAEHMRGCSIAVGAPGMSTWERACMGLPAAHVTNSDSQVGILLDLKKTGFCEWLGRAETITDHEFIAGMSAFLNDEDRLERMRHMGLSRVDGKGAQRVVGAMSAGLP